MPYDFLSCPAYLQSAKKVQYVIYRRTFRRESDKARHKCISERKKPIHQQAGAIQCERWLKSKGDFESTQVQAKPYSVI